MYKILDVTVNYYTGEKWFLINLGKGETYVSEKKYEELVREANNTT